jgi:uncharacterized protein (TIGR04222 family)
MTNLANLSCLYGCLLSYDLSDPKPAPSFEERLANENQWTLGYATQVSNEYRRFLFLTQCAGEPMCPSTDVDQAWHLHLTQTRSYQRMCGDVLGYFLHHDSSKEGPAELRKHQAMYEATLHAYRKHFGTEPPAAIWPKAAQRFGPPSPATREPSRKIPVVLRGVALSWLGLMLMAATGGCLVYLAIGASLWPDIQSVEFGAVYLMALALTLGIFHARRKLQGTGGGPVPVLDPYEVAWLAGGQERVIGTALASLVDRGLLKMDVQKQGDKITGGTCRRTEVEFHQSPLHDVERACLAAIPQGDVDMAALRQVAFDRFQGIARRLEAAGLLHRTGHLSRDRAVAGCLLGVLLVLGFSRLWFGFAEGHPVWFLIVMLVANARFAAGMFAATAAPSLRGQRTLLALARQNKTSARVVKGGTKVDPVGSQSADPGKLVTLAFALFGTQAVMALDHFAGINYLFGSGNGNVTGDSRSVAGCGGGCSGGGGGGCGGCGGCGG